MSTINDTQNDDNDNSKLEAQFILRLPTDLAENVRNVLKTKPKKIKKYMSIQMNPETREGQVRFNKTVVPLKLVDLPTIVESLKSIDKKFFFKSADIHQMYLTCKSEENNNIEETNKPNLKKYLWPHGLTPSLKNVRKSRFRKTMKNKHPLDGPEIENEVKWLLKMDNEAIAVRWEFVEDDQYVQKNDNNLNLDEKEVFGEISDSISEDEFQDLLQEFQDEPEDNEIIYNYHDLSPS